MTGGRCHGEKKMMTTTTGRVCGTEEDKPSPISRVPPNFPATLPEIPKNPIDSFSQACKALCERSPYDVVDDASAPGGTCAATASVAVPATLPRGLASFLSKQSDSRKRHKKSHAASERKHSRQSEKSRGYRLWAETEEYFRPLTLSDIEALAEVSELSKVAATKCVPIPHLGNIPELNGNGNLNVEPGCCEECGCGGNSNEIKDEMNVIGGNGNEVAAKNGGEVVGKDENADGGGGNSVVVEKANENGVVEDEVKTEQNGQSMEIDSVAEEDKSCFVSDSPRGVEWLLGYRNKTCLATERPSKKRKVLGADAGLEKVISAAPCDGDHSLCHFCCKGDEGQESNRLIVCSSCKVVVHRKCYGVLEDVDTSWSCSWCKHNTGVSDLVNPCVLCSKQGGALKPVLKEGNSDRSIEFAHLFCCQWMPETYIEDMEKVEPIVNVGGIPETRRKMICNICKVKCGACVRCSHGACRTSFHPMCAREARQRMEIWAKFGLNNVELKAFCPKHSELPINSTAEPMDPSVSIDKTTSISESPHMTLLQKKLNKLKTGRKNGDSLAVTIETSDDSNKFSDSRSQDIPRNDMGKIEKGCEDVDESGALNLMPLLKKLIDCGKVDLKDVALDIGLSPNSLAASLSDDSVVPDLQSRIVKWLKEHTYLDLMQKNVKTNLRPLFASMAEFGAPLSESGMSDLVAVKSVPPRRRTKGGGRNLKDKKVFSSLEQTFCGNGIQPDKINSDKFISEGPTNSREESISDVVEKNITVLKGLQDSLPTDELEGYSVKSSICSFLQSGQDAAATIPLQTDLVIANVDPVVQVEKPIPESNKPEAESSSSCAHLPIQRTTLQMQNETPLKNTVHGSSEKEVSRVDASSHASVCCNHQNIHLKCHEASCKSDEMNLEQLAKAQKLGVLEMSPEDELEGELIYYQHRLQNNITSRKHYTDVLMSNVAKRLPKEIDTARNQKWDAVLISQYLCELREAKKQGRKERRHKEAQAVLAAATAAAAASSRISSFRKDVLDDPSHQENVVKLSSLSGRSGFSSQMIPRAKETFPRVAVPRVSVEKHSGIAHSGSDVSKEHPRSCDICRRSETILNPILVCSSCKVAVHLDCYRSTRESTGPWYCELCEGKATANIWEKEHLTAECGLCGGKAGAFRKSSDGQWVHAFCAEWVFESTFKRGQVSSIVGMDTVTKGLDFCCICRRKFGVCIKCSYGHCQATFHPFCARSSDFYMNVKNLGGKQQHKAYCERHSLEQKAKADTQKHGMEELKNLHTIRAELERLRLICERIIKREKVKRELLICSHDLLAVKRDHVTRSVLVNSPFLLPDASSESATTSLKAHTDDYRSCSDTFQRSDDVTVDSSISFKHRTRVPITIDNDQRTDDDSSTSQIQFTQNISERMQFAEKHIPFRPVVNCNLLEDGGYRLKSKKHAEMFSKEMVMTSDQASVKNMLLPKGYAYVPADCIPSEKQVNQDACSGEQPEGDG
ncbi:uncharacterized protein LOC126793646 [Argentina anserina]|uniref:uncharacterized protein LOC126793646 n=1 Tax=Argentina anserina TaxID=57926 RepID=UPI00217646BF|nr:uncharacterized protein LOC126793646 [Potentilla anserina]XP_050376193.1 uncharacterized protein LOC126793646 [Potentilla anserina]